MWGPARQTTVQSWAPGGRPGAAWGAWGACRGVVWGCGLLPSRSLRGCGEEDAGELRPEDLGMGAGALAAGYPRLGWPGCPGVPWGQRLPTSAGCETTTCVSVTEVLRVLPQELTRRGDCGPGGPGGMTKKREWGAMMSLAVGTFPWPGGGRCPGLFPSSRGRGAVVGGGVATPQRVSVPGAVGTDPSALLAARTARIMQQGAAWARTARAGRAAPAGVGDRGGTGGGVRGSRQVDGGWRGLVPRTGGPHHPPVGRRGCRGCGGPTQGPSPPPVRFRCRGGEAKATRGHDTWCIGRRVGHMQRHDACGRGKGCKA